MRHHGEEVSTGSTKEGMPAGDMPEAEIERIDMNQ
jgi:hypothetical protein